MNNRLKKVFVFLFSIILIFQFSTLLTTAKKTESLPNKYGYDENFKYDDVTIAHVLKATTVYIECTYSSVITYDTIDLDSKLISEAAHAMLESYPDTDSDIVYEALLDSIIDNIGNYASIDSENSIDAFIGARGSGVIISEDGYIATNSHVVNAVTDEGKEQAVIEYLSQSVYADIDNAISDLRAMGFEPTETQLSDLEDLFISEAANSYSVDEGEFGYYVFFPSASGEAFIDDSRVFEAKLIKDGTPVDSPDTAGLTEDGAIIKINSNNLIALNFSDSYPESNSKIVSAGFPAAANEIFARSTETDESILSVSTGTGNVSRLIPIEGTDYKSIEITTTISQGSSGGPSVDANLNIEGLNTYGNSDDLRFAYMIPAAFLNDLAADCDIGSGETTKVFLTGLQMLQQGYGAAASECFEQVKKLKKDTPYIANLITLSEKADQKYPDGTEKEDKKDSSASSDSEENSSDLDLAATTKNDKKSGNGMLMRILIIVGIGLLVIGGIATAIVLIARSSGRKKEMEESAISTDYPYETEITYAPSTHPTTDLDYGASYEYTTPFSPSHTESHAPIHNPPTHKPHDASFSIPSSHSMDDSFADHSSKDVLSSFSSPSNSYQPPQTESKPKIKFSKNLKKDDDN